MAASLKPKLLRFDEASSKIEDLGYESPPVNPRVNDSGDASSTFLSSKWSWSFTSLNSAVSKKSTSSKTSRRSWLDKFRKTKLECVICCEVRRSEEFPKILGCPKRKCCQYCMTEYIEQCISLSRIEMECPHCDRELTPQDIIKFIGNRPELLEKYYGFTLRKYLLSEPDARGCPAPDCSYVVIASGCAACPLLVCEREGCETKFCYHCKDVWHPTKSCDESRAERGVLPPQVDNEGGVDMEDGADSSSAETIKNCPKCCTSIAKANDGSCNHMYCPMCRAEFCWLCMKEITDFHFISPSGCTFWGERPWTRQKKMMWRIGALLGAPFGISLLAVAAVPGVLIGLPVIAGMKMNKRLRKKKRNKFVRTVGTSSAALGAVVVSPIVATVAIGLGVPILFAYVYTVVPLSMCGSRTRSNRFLRWWQTETEAARERMERAKDSERTQTRQDASVQTETDDDASTVFSDHSSESDGKDKMDDDLRSMLDIVLTVFSDFQLD